MTMDVFTKALAPVLGYPETEVVKWLEAVYQKIAEELVLNGEVYLAGVGVLQRVHIPSEPREEDGRLVLVPPRHEVRLVEKEVSEDGLVYEVGIEQLQLQEEVAQKFSKGFARVVEKVVEVHGSLQLGKLGQFVRHEQGGILFKQSPLLSELLDKPFVGLLPVVISERQKMTTLVQATLQPTDAEASNTPEWSATVQHEARDGQNFDDTTEWTAQRTQSDAEGSSAKSPVRSPMDEPDAFKEQKDLEPAVFPSSQDVSGRDPLFVLLAAAAEAQPERQAGRSVKSQRATNAGYENKASFRYESSATGSSNAWVEELSPSSPSSSTEEHSVVDDKAVNERETQVLRNIAIATGIVFFTIIIAFVIVKYDSISFRPSAPPSPADRARIEAEKAAAARAEAERILAEKTIPRKSADSDSSIKQTGTILKNTTQAAKNLPKELTTIDLSKGGYTLIVASQPTREAALLVVEEFGKLGLAATVVEKRVGKSIRYRVRVGQFDTFAEARAAKKKYKTLIPADAFMDKVSPLSPKERGD